MDYPAVPMSHDSESNSQFYTTRPGPYDRWAIEYGYSASLPKTEEEAARLETILSRSTEPELAFANDADDMRAPGKAIDPRAMIFDLTSDPITFADHQIDFINQLQPLLKERLLKKGDSYQALLNSYFFSRSRFRGAVNLVSRFVRGVYVDRAMVDQANASQPLTPVSLEDQKRAMNLLSEKLFAPHALDAWHVYSESMLSQRRGWEHGDNTEDPKLHAMALDFQKGVLDHLLHPRVLARLTDSARYGNEYTIHQLFVDLTVAIFQADLHENVNTIRQNLQLEYVDRLLAIVKSNDYDTLSKSMALNRLHWIKQQATEPHPGLSLSTQPHHGHIVYRIESSLRPHS